MNHIPTVEIRNIKLPDDIELVRKLWTDYLTWGNETMQINYGVHPHNPTKIVEQDKYNSALLNALDSFDIVPTDSDILELNTEDFTVQQETIEEALVVGGERGGRGGVKMNTPTAKCF